LSAQGSGQGPRRVWTGVAVVPHGTDGDGFLVTLDGKPVRLPSGGPLLLPSRVLADAVAAEWAQAGGGAVGGRYAPDSLGLTRLAGALQERIAVARDQAIGALLRYLDSEALCYRAAHPASLVARQQAAWQPWLDWAARRFGLQLAVTQGVMPLAQSGAASGTARAILDAQDDAALTALGVLAPLSGSLVLGLAVVDGALDAAEAHRLSLLDDSFQAERWGADDEAVARHAGLLDDFLEAERFLTLARSIGRTHLLISGRVQGVGYRAWLQDAAQQRGLTGWTRNLSDGRVEALLCGPEASRNALIARAAAGPAMARVDGVAVTGLAHAAPTVGFVIRSTGHSSEPV
jgi:chaperone required for assembly of F1-ATPase/acylphosphatase